MRRVDLHIHTTASDGSLSPREVVNYAKEKGLAAVAITDHDTTAGVKEAVEEGKRIGVEVVEGVELSVDFSGGTMHLLGYFIDPEDKELNERLRIVQRARAERNEKMVKRLNELGMEISLEEVRALASDGQVCRPHFAQLLVKKGYVRDIDEAFERFLCKGGPAYVEKFKFPPSEAIDFIHRAGGLAVLAHPFTLNLDEGPLERLVRELKEAGLEGIEVFYPDHTSEQTAFYQELAKRYDLVITGGTDYHGKVREGIEIGVGYGDMNLPYSILEGMKERRERNRALGRRHFGSTSGDYRVPTR